MKKYYEIKVTNYYVKNLTYRIEIDVQENTNIEEIIKKFAERKSVEYVLLLYDKDEVCVAIDTLEYSYKEISKEEYEKIKIK